MRLWLQAVSDVLTGPCTRGIDVDVVGCVMVVQWMKLLREGGCTQAAT